MKRHNTRKHYNLYDQVEQTAMTAKNLLVDAIINFQNNGNTNHAAAIAFYSLLSIVPLALLTALTASLLLGSSADFYANLHKWLRYYQPGISMDVFAGVIDKIGGNIKIIGSFALLTTLWFSSFVFGAIETAFNAIFRSHKIRNYVVSKVLATAMIPLCWLIASGLVFANYFAEILFKHPVFTKTYIVYPFIQEWIFPIVLPFVVACIFFFLIYKLLPTNKSIGKTL